MISFNYILNDMATKTSNGDDMYNIIYVRVHSYQLISPPLNRVGRQPEGSRDLSAREDYIGVPLCPPRFLSPEPSRDGKFPYGGQGGYVYGMGNTLRLIIGQPDPF